MQLCSIARDGDDVGLWLGEDELEHEFVGAKSALDPREVQWLSKDAAGAAEQLRLARCQALLRDEDLIKKTAAFGRNGRSE
jgi:hypothetical protein